MVAKIALTHIRVLRECSLSNLHHPSLHRELQSSTVALHLFCHHIARLNHQQKQQLLFSIQKFNPNWNTFFLSPLNRAFCFCSANGRSHFILYNRKREGLQHFVRCALYSNHSPVQFPFSLSSYIQRCERGTIMRVVFLAYRTELNELQRIHSFLRTLRMDMFERRGAELQSVMEYICIQTTRIKLRQWFLDLS